MMRVMIEVGHVPSATFWKNRVSAGGGLLTEELPFKA